MLDKYQTQKDDAKQNEAKIIRFLQDGTKNFTELKELSKYSNAGLIKILNRLQIQGKIIQDKHKLYYATKEGLNWYNRHYLNYLIRYMFDSRFCYWHTNLSESLSIVEDYAGMNGLPKEWLKTSGIAVHTLRNTKTEDIGQDFLYPHIAGIVKDALSSYIENLQKIPDSDKSIPDPELIEDKLIIALEFDFRKLADSLKEMRKTRVKGDSL